MTAPAIHRFSYGVTSLADALRWNWRGWHLSQKMDGIWQQREIADSILIGEAMRGGGFFAFDCPVAYGEDVRRRAWTERREAMRQIAREADVNTAPEGYGVEFLEAVLANGGEGIVAKPFSSLYGFDWFKVKRRESFDVVVTAKLRGAIAIQFLNQDAGKCALAGRNHDLVRIGDVIEIAAVRRNVSGKFREPKFLRIRRDKMEASQ
jgi:ATP-dependent DNA ligase